MSGIARLLAELGRTVSGSDCSANALTESLEALGIPVRIGHAAGHLGQADAVVYSSSITPNNPELLAARNRGLPTFHRGLMVANLMQSKRVIAVTGAHGKSTTASMLAQTLLGTGWDPTALLGAELPVFGSSARWGKSDYAVVEADESDGSLLWLRPRIGIITNMDEEHLDYFRNTDEITQMYTDFARHVDSGGLLVGCVDDPKVRQLFKRVSSKQITYGLCAQADVRARRIESIAGSSRYDCWIDGRRAGSVELQVPGRHNVVNSLAVLAVAHRLGIDLEMVRLALRSYRGARRRFQILGEPGGVLIVEDYGHHPAEVAATLEAARSWPDRRIICVFQPHRYSRTKHFMNEFGPSFRKADQVELLPIYSASEDPIEGIGSHALAEKIREAGVPVSVAVSADALLERLGAQLKSGDMLLFMGAGSVGPLAHQFYKQFCASQAEKGDYVGLVPVG